MAALCPVPLFPLTLCAPPRLVFQPRPGRAGKESRPASRRRAAGPSEEPANELAARARAAWARLIREVYKADPLECPKCKGSMQVIALIEDPGVIRRILDHLELWAPLATGRSPPLGLASWPRYVDLSLTYRSVPDIA